MSQWGGRWDRLAWGVLAAAMCVSALWLFDTGRNLTFSGDGVFYYASLVDTHGVIAPGSGVEYLLAPHNGHLVVLGKLLYRALFVTVGTDYAVFRMIEIGAVLLCVLLFFVLTRRRIGALPALIPSVLLLFLGYAAESYLWPFDIHTIGALACGLGALLALDREDRRGDVAACALLTLSVATVEVGLAFVVGAAVSVLQRHDRLRRAWIILIPVALYSLWWVWAQRFGQTSVAAGNLPLVPLDSLNALAAITGSIFGLNPTGPDVPVNTTGITIWGIMLAVLAVAGMAWRLRRGAVPPTLWVSLAVILTYWGMIALGGRAPDASRYVFTGSLMVMLIATDLLRGVKVAWWSLAAAVLVLALSIPANLAKLRDWRQRKATIATAARTEYAMLELARGRVHPEYDTGFDPRVLAAGGFVYLPLSAGEYFRASAEFGSLAYPLRRVRESAWWVRRIADASLVGADRIRLQRSSRPGDHQSCRRSRDGTRRDPVYFPLPRNGVRLSTNSDRAVEVAIDRFAGGRGVKLGSLEAGRWTRLVVPPDRAPDRWNVVVDGPVYVCPPRG